jgi:phosphoribosylanthranilate isomerase
MRVAVKICGITNSEDARAAVAAGADYIGVIVEIKGSLRSVSIDAAQHIMSSVTAPGVLLLEKQISDVIRIAHEITPHAVQLIGHVQYTAIEKLKANISCNVWKTLQIPQHVSDAVSVSEINGQIQDYRSAGVDVIVLDTLVRHNGAIQKGGTGQTCDWRIANEIVAAASLSIFLAGGITPINAQAAVMAVHPQGIDVSSGVEQGPGKKDPDKIQQLIQTVHAVETAQR